MQPGDRLSRRRLLHTPVHAAARMLPRAAWGAALLATLRHDAACALSHPSEAAAGQGPVFDVLMVSTREHYFDPVGLWVPAGATVRWVLHSGVHGATAYHPRYYDKPLRIPEQAQPWDSGMMAQPGQSFSVTFTVEGVYDYYCLPHESMGMVGRLVVGEPRPGPATRPLPADFLPMARMVLERLRPERIVRERAIPWRRR